MSSVSDVSVRLCEQVFSFMNYVKSRPRTYLTDEGFEGRTWVATTEINRDIKIFLKSSVKHLSNDCTYQKKILSNMWTCLQQ
jgi:hypothetical protein